MAGETSASSDKTLRCQKISSTVLLIIGVLLIIAGVVLLFVLKNEVSKQVDDQLALKNGTESFNAWVDPPVPVYMQFWMWDLTNPDDFLNKGAKPILKEKGPYTYREYRPRKDIVFSDNDTFVSYIQPKTYVFLRNMSVGDENDTFFSVNFPVLTAATLLRFTHPEILDPLLRGLLEVLGEKLFMNHTVGGYLWGYKEPTIKKINDLTERLFHIKVIKNDTFGLFSGPTANGTDDGHYTVYSGRKDIKRYNSIYEWQYNRSVPYWNDTYCNQINGTDGSGWHPFVKKSDVLYIFSSDVCRSVYTVYKEDVKVKGIPMYSFTTPDSVLADHVTNPANKGFCTPDCMGAGVLNVSRCREGAPVIVSQPHFYQGAQKYIDAFEGMNPDPEQHATVIDVEPVTGAALRAAKKLQLNFFIRRLKSFKGTERMEPNGTVWPVVWLNESAMITDDAAAEFKNKVLSPVEVSRIVPWVITGIGILLIIIGIILLIIILLKTKQASGKGAVSGTSAASGGEPGDDPRQGLLNSSDPHNSYHSTADA